MDLKSGDQSCVAHKQLNCPNCCSRNFRVVVFGQAMLSAEFFITAKTREEATAQAREDAKVLPIQYWTNEALSINQQVSIELE